MNFKWLLVPESNATKEVKVAQLWEVRWNAVEFSRLWDYEHSCEHKPQVETFLNEAEAVQFKEALEKARTLLRITKANPVQMERAK